MTSTEGGRSRFSRDVLWNVGSLALAGGCGLLLNFLISLVYGAGALGVFNQVFAFYIVLSQLAALGFHYSVLTHIAAATDDAERRAILTSALVSSGVIAAFAGLVCWALARPAGALLDSAEVARGIPYVAPGVALFALNKITLGALNGVRSMRLYAVFFAGRFVFMIAAFGACVALHVEQATLPVILTAAEAATLVITLVPLRRLVGPVPRAALRSWLDQHVRFGLKGFMSGMLAELNTRVDVLILGIFTDDRTVGAYSFAAILAEGVFQLYTALRSNYAPILVRLWAARKTDELGAIIARGRNRTYLASLVGGAVLVGGYVLVVPRITSEPEIQASWPFFAALVAGMVASSGYQPFQTFLLYVGLPGWHTWLMVAVVAANALGNVILIMAIGPIGAAVATGITFVVGVLLLRIIVRWKLRLAF